MELIPVTLQSQPFWLTLEKCLPKDANAVSDGGTGAIISVSSLPGLRTVHRNLRKSFDFKAHLDPSADWLTTCGELHCTIRVSVGSGSSRPPTVTDHELQLRRTSPSGFPPPTSPAEMFEFKLDHNTAPAECKEDLPFMSLEELDAYVEHVLDKTAALLVQPPASSTPNQTVFPRHVAEILQEYARNARDLPTALDPALRLSIAAKLLQAHQIAVIATFKEFEEEEGLPAIYTGRVQPPPYRDPYSPPEPKSYWGDVDDLAESVARVSTYYDALKKVLTLDKDHGGINRSVSQIKSELHALLKKKLGYSETEVDRSDALMAFRIDLGIPHQAQVLGNSLGITAYPGFFDRFNPFYERHNDEKISALIDVVKDLRGKFPAGREIMEAQDKFNMAALAVSNGSSIRVFRTGTQRQGLCVLSPEKLNLLRQLIADGKGLVKADENEKIRHLASYFDLVPKIPMNMTFYRKGDF